MLKGIFNRIISVILLLSIISCNAGIPEVKKSVTNDSSIRKSVAKSIEQQLDILEDYQDEDLLDLLEAKDSSGEEIVSKALGETNGANYLDFCYATNQTCVLGDSSYIMDSAKNLMSSDKYNELKSQIDQNEKGIKNWGDKAVKGVPTDQQEAFYKDLKNLAVKSTVMLVAAFVYVAIPAEVVWGKIPAAAALAIGSGMAASVLLDVYGYYKIGYVPDILKTSTTSTNLSTNTDLSSWVTKLKKDPAADYALATAITSYATTIGLGKIPTAIVLCVYTAYNALTTITEMRKTYNFKA